MAVLNFIKSTRKIFIKIIKVNPRGVIRGASSFKLNLSVESFEVHDIVLVTLDIYFTYTNAKLFYFVGN